MSLDVNKFAEIIGPLKETAGNAVSRATLASVSKLRSAGVSNEEIRRQALAFQDAVRVELQRLAVQSMDARC